MAIVLPQDVADRSWVRLLTVQNIACTVLFGVAALLILYPIALLILNGFTLKNGAGQTRFGYDLWMQTWRQPGLPAAVLNSFKVVGASTTISLPVALVLAWLATRTDMPGKSLLSACCWIAFFMPVLPVVLGWILLFDPHAGIVNRYLKTQFGVIEPIFNIYSFWGIVFCHLVTKSIAAKYIFLVPAFRNISATIEESSHIVGAGACHTFLRIVVPIMMPAILITLVVSLIHAFESFEIELILGSPFNFSIFSTKIYQLIREEPPQFGMATVLGLGILLSMLPLILFERYFGLRRNYTMLGGNFRIGLLKLRYWRWPIFAIAALFCMVITLVPIVLLSIGSFMKLFGFFEIAGAFTTQNWTRVYTDSNFFQALINTLRLGISASVIGTLLAALIAYVAVRTKYPLRRGLDFISWLPASIPGIILGLGMLWMFLTIPLFHPFYGTIGVLIIAVVTSTLTTGTQLIKSNMMQLGHDMEEASSITGGSWFYTFRRVVIPMLGQSLIAVAVLTFASAAANVSSIAMLVTANNRPLSMLQVDYMVDGTYERATVVGLTTVGITMGVAGLAVFFARRLGLRTST